MADRLRTPARDGVDADDRLMVAVQGGDLDSLGLLFERHHRPLYGFFARLTGDRPASEDLVQDVFFRVLKYRATYQPGTQFRTWLYHLARNAHIDRFKARPREVAIDERTPDPPSAVASPVEDLEDAERTALLREALARLPPEKREVLVLSRFQGLKYEQIGELLGCEVGAVKVRVYRAVRALRRVFDELSDEGRAGRLRWPREAK